MLSNTIREYMFDFNLCIKFRDYEGAIEVLRKYRAYLCGGNALLENTRGARYIVWEEDDGDWYAHRCGTGDREFRIKPEWLAGKKILFPINPQNEEDIE